MSPGLLQSTVFGPQIPVGQRPGEDLRSPKAFADTEGRVLVGLPKAAAKGISERPGSEDGGVDGKFQSRGHGTVID